MPNRATGRYGRPVPLPFSRKEMDRLGKRLASADAISDADYTQLAEVVGAYQEVLGRVERRLAGIELRATTRVKTTGTLVDKLRRETTM